MIETYLIHWVDFISKHPQSSIVKANTGLLLTILLILTNRGFAQQSPSLAPEATADEVAGSFWDVPPLEEAFIDASPTKRKDGILVGELGIDGGNKAMIVKLAKEIADSTYGIYDSFLIAYKGKLLFESYFTQSRINLPHPQSSATKSYTSLALGRAIQLGYLSMADLDKPLVSFLNELDPTKFVEGAEKITLHKALTMSGGLRVSSDKWKELQEDPAALQGQGLVQTLLEHSSPITAESQGYAYGNFNSNLVMSVIEAVVPGTAKDFIKHELLDKLGITNYRWQTHVSGLPEAGWRVSMTPRDMVKWGTLVLNKGKWNGEQLVPEAYVTKATSAITQPTETWQPKTYRYGYFWYQTNIDLGPKSYKAHLAWGGGGQHIIVLEELDLIIVVTGQDMDDTIMTQVSEIVLPAFAPNKSPLLQGPYIGQETPGLTPKAFAPGMVTTDGWEYGGAFTPDLEEFYFLRYNEETEDQEFVVVYQRNNTWLDSVISPRLGQPFIAPDGQTLHLGKRYKNRGDSGWSEVKNLGAPFDSLPIMRLTASANGTYFFDEFKRDFTGSIRYSRLVNGKHEDPKLLNSTINAGKSFHPFIAPDESYLIFDGKREDGFGNSDIYISFKQQDGSWGDPINMGDQINTEAWEACATVTLDGKYLFFNRNMGSDQYENVDIFWVDARIIEHLRTQ